MQIQLIIALLVSAFSFGGAWKIQDWRYNAKEKERVEQKMDEIRVSAARDLRWVDNVMEARDRAVVRSYALRADANSSRSAAVGLSNALATTMREAESSKDACIKRITTVGELLEKRTEEYRDLGEKADRHVNDIKALIESVPK